MLTRRQKWLIVPLEITDRELIGKLLVASAMIDRGWQVILGPKHAILAHLDQLPPGVMLLKSIIRSEHHYLQDYVDRGHKLVCLDEEGLIQTSLERMVEMRTDPSTLTLVEKFLFWGEIQYRTFMDIAPAFADKYAISGNPRVDSWSPRLHGLYQPETDALKDRFGDYIFLPTSFAMFNHFLGENGAIDIYRADKMSSQQDYGYHLEYRRFVKQIFEGFLELVPELARRFPERNIIIRPHPSENRSPWDALAADLPNVHVEYEGNVTPWLLGASLILHCGSTTAVEAHIAGKPVISFCPCPKEDIAKFELYVPALVSIHTTTVEEVLDQTGALLSNTPVAHDGIAAGHATLKQWIDSLDDSRAAQKLADILDNIDVEEQVFPDSFREVHKLPDWRERIWAMIMKVDAIVPSLRPFLPVKLQKGIRTREYGNHKSSSISRDAVKGLLERLARIENRPEISVTEIAANIMMLSGQSSPNK